MSRYPPSLLDRLFDDDASSAAGMQQSLRIDEVKARVARDVEHLLNARCGLRRGLRDRYPNVLASVAGFGMSDFSSLSLASAVDRQAICRFIQEAISDHEPRLKSVQVELVASGGFDSRLRFSIDAVLVLAPDHEPVCFNALLQPTTQQYQVADHG